MPLQRSHDRPIWLLVSKNVMLVDAGGDRTQTTVATCSSSLLPYSYNKLQYGGTVL